MSDRFVICVCTFRRPDSLTALLRSLAKSQTVPDADISLIVIDNDTEAKLAPLVETLAGELRWPVRYVHEPEAGISPARNRAIEEAGQSGYMLFVDDDETVAIDWLPELVSAVRKTKATFVQGPVVMTVEDRGDEWFLESVFFKQKTFEDGTPRHESWTNNVAIDLAFLHRTGCRFEHALRFEGGEDTLFFQDIIRAGGNGIYAAKAKVFEVQPKDRLTWSWALNRQYRYGVTRANTALMRSGRVSATMYCLVRSAGMFTVGLGHMMSALVRGKRGIANGTAFIARAAGVLMGCFGARKLVYAR